MNKLRENKNAHKAYVLLMLCLSLCLLVFGCSKDSSTSEKSEETDAAVTVETTAEALPTPSPTPSPSPTPTPTPTPRLVKKIQYEPVGNDWVPYQTTEYDEYGNAVYSWYNNGGGDVTYEYNDDHQLIKSVMSTNYSVITTEYFYDGDLLSIMKATYSYSDGSEDEIIEHRSEYDDNGREISDTLTTPDGPRKTIYEYDDDHLVKQVTYEFENDELGIIESSTTYEYGRSGNLVRETMDIPGTCTRVTIYEYDENGDVIRETFDCTWDSIYLSNEHAEYEYEYFYE